MSFKVAIIGHTGRGNYGHYLDMAFVGVEGAEIAALADPDDEGGPRRPSELAHARPTRTTASCWTGRSPTLPWWRRAKSATTATW